MSKQFQASQKNFHSTLLLEYVPGSVCYSNLAPLCCLSRKQDKENFPKKMQRRGSLFACKPTLELQKRRRRVLQGLFCYCIETIVCQMQAIQDSTKLQSGVTQGNRMWELKKKRRQQTKGKPLGKVCKRKGPTHLCWFLMSQNEQWLSKIKRMAFFFSFLNWKGKFNF